MVESSSNRVLYLDFSETANHADALFSVARFLAGRTTRWVFDESYRGHLPDDLKGAAVVWLPRGRGPLAALRAARHAAREVRRFGPDVVHVNGAQGKRARAFALFTLGSPATFSGMHHNPVKLLGSGSQWLINRRIRRYGVPAEFIRDEVRPRLPAGVSVEAVRPIFFPTSGESPPTDRLRVAIVGSLSAERRGWRSCWSAMPGPRPAAA